MKSPLIISLFATCLCSNAIAAPDEAAILNQDADLAVAKYEDSLVTAQRLQQAVDHKPD